MPKESTCVEHHIVVVVVVVVVIIIQLIIHMCVYIYIYIHVYIFISVREPLAAARVQEGSLAQLPVWLIRCTGTGPPPIRSIHPNKMYMCVYIYIYIYIYIHT